MLIFIYIGDAICFVYVAVALRSYSEKSPLKIVLVVCHVGDFLLPNTLLYMIDSSKAS